MTLKYILRENELLANLGLLCTAKAADNWMAPNRETKFTVYRILATKETEKSLSLFLIVVEISRWLKVLNDLRPSRS